MKKTMKNFAMTMVLAAGALLAPAAALAASGGDIYEIRPVDETGAVIPAPMAMLNAGDTARFAVRLAKPTSTGNRFHLVHIKGTGSEAVHWYSRRPAIGIYVNGKFTLAYMDEKIGENPRTDVFTDFIFSYTVQPGDFALPIRLADSNKALVTEDKVEPSTSYYLDFQDFSIGMPVWKIDDSDDDGANPTKTANFQYGTPDYPVSGPDGQRVYDYDLSKCNFKAQTVDFDPYDETKFYWRSVHQGSTQVGGAAPSLVVSSLPTNSVRLYLWSTDESSFYLAKGEEMDVHVTADTTAKRHVLAVDIISGKQTYEFEIEGVMKNTSAEIVLSAFPDFHYKTSGYTSPERLDDFVTRTVMCSDPLPASVVCTPALPKVTATSSWNESVTTLDIHFTEPFTEDVEMTIEPGFSQEILGVDWSDYVRFSAKAEDEVDMQKNIQFPKVVIKEGETKPSTIDLGDGPTTLTDGKIYVYALRSDDNVTAADRKLTFKVTTENEQAKKPASEGGINDWGKESGLNIDAQIPVIVTPEEGDDSLTAVAGSPRTLRIALADTYADTVSKAGYTIEITRNSDTESTFTTLPGTYAAKNGFLYKVVDGTISDELPSTIYTVTDPAANKSILRVKSPVSGKQSDERNFTVTVTAPASMTIDTADKVYEYIEGNDVAVVVTLDRQNTTGNSLYAFLVPVTDKDRNAADCSFLAQEGGTGLEIGQYGTSVSGYFTLIDGCSSAATSQFSYKVMLRTARVFEEGTEVSTFLCKNTLVLKSTNVIPTVTAVELGLNQTDEKGEFPGILIPKGVPQQFTALVDEPGLADLRATGTEAFQVKWIFSISGSGNKAPEEADAKGIIYGDPADHPATFSFTKAGRWTVTLQLKDKDMSKFGNGKLDEKFVFYVDVVDQPAITVTGFGEGEVEKSVFEENESLDAGGGAWINVNLAFNKCDDPLTVQLTVTPGGADNPGVFVLQENSYTTKTGDGVYEVTFPAGEVTLPVNIKTLDGTQVSRTQGFTFTPKMLSTVIVPDSGDKPASEYYVGTAKILKVNNVAPLVEDADLYPQPGTNVIETALGAADPISWNFTDVLPDFEGGITVTVKGGGGFTETVYEPGQAAGTFTPVFTVSGEQTVQLTIRDKDNGSVSFIWKYNVAVAKTMTMRPHGPTGGYGTANSKRYRTAAGRGEGRVWAKGLSDISGFESKYNCAKATDWTVYAYGYKVGDIDDGVNLWKYADRDTPINALGNAKGATEGGYVYVPRTDHNGSPVDSFLYTWLLVSRSDEGGALTDAFLGEAFSPEYPLTTDAGTAVALPNEENEDKTFEDTKLEAVFSREYLATDNMGDINQDGIPDIYVDKYGMGVVDTSTGKLAEEGTDLESLAGYNEDTGDGENDEGGAGDYLPGDATAFLGVLMPNTKDKWTKKFTADLEIRGFGEGLNDAPVQLGLTGVKPDLVYLNPDPLAEDYCPSSTLSKVEYLAWSEYAAANGIADPSDPATWRKADGSAVWSPERPTDPTKKDTDGDGMEDGYEYYYWYLAHVGYIDAQGAHRRLTGRRYNPRNPGEGDFIDSATIEAIVDPLVKYTGADADSVDTDNDGIPDLLEFEIGTNPFDFDTDGDGLPDGWEVMISGTNPLKAYTTPGICDAMRNYDGDAMAFTTPRLESGVQPKPFVTVKPTTFALVQAGGMTDGVQWYASEKPLAAGALAFEEATSAGTAFTAGGQLYFTKTSPLPVTAGGVLAASLDKTAAWTALDLSKEADARKLTDLGLEVPEGIDCVRLMPTYVPAGTPVSVVEGEKTCATLVLTEKVTGTQAAWVYGSVKVPTLTTGQTSANKGGFGMLALGKYLDAPAKTPLAALPKEDADIAYLHYLVYQQFGFDPRTAWNANTPLNARWGKTADGEAKADGLGSGNGYAGQATRTREYTAYDEFLVYSFFLNNGMTTLMYEELGDKAPEMAELWYANTTNPQGPNEPDIDTVGGGEQADAASAGYWGRNSDSGADTDLDGVPDGWELYVMSGPKKGGKFVFPAPYDDVPYSSFSPFVPDAKKASATDNKDLEDGAAGDADNLTEYQEFEGTDTMAWYRTVAPATPTIVHDATWTWFNKFFPTDPWNDDTDGDGLKDNENSSKDQLQAFSRCANFTYADVDTGKTCIPGGGLNPCSVDTDQDGLPDAWEAQFAGTKESVYTGAECQYASGTDAEGNEKTSTAQTLQGLADGMDGTVKDAYNYVRINRTTDSGTTSLLVSVNGVNQVVDRDYDHDGLDNWQEYLVGTMRCWRYDDPVSPWISIPTAYYFDEDGVFNPFRDGPDGEGNYYLKLLGITSGTEEEFWYRTLFDKTSKAYNPHLVTDSSSSSLYFSRVTNGFDPNFTDKGSYYVFHDRINADELLNLWGGAPVKYVSCSPVKADTDGDGMDDYYELFHGLNPLLGAAGVRSGGDMCDIVFDAWSTSTVDAPITALKNVWTLNAKSLLGREPRTNDPENNKFDFELFPWLNGLALADADGDDIRNCDEAIMPMIAPQATWRHTDPSSLWFTDSSYTNSLVNRFYRLPATYADITLPYETFTYKDQTYSFTEADGYYVDAFGIRHLAPFTADWWKLTSASSQNYMFSFEENEGYDTDHDGISDFEELQGRPTGTVSDPQEADSPYRRQAMYFPGDKAALQSMPFVKEGHPRYGYGYPDDMSFVQYTVECWVRPEEADPAKSYTVLERAIWADYSAAGDEKLLRKNFQLAIRQGCWYTKFDANGTLEDSVVELQSTKAAELGTWTHLAATYDGSVLRLYVNGSEVNKTGVSGRGLKPEYGSSAVVVHPGEGLATTNGMYLGRADTYWYDREYALHAFIVGASAQSLHVTNGVHNSHLNVMNGRGWDRYEDFFKGYVDEIRIWDGARPAADIAADRMRRYTADDVKANRAAFYDQWASGKFRYGKDGNGKDYDVIPELRYHWSFDSLPAAENPAMAAKSAHGYGYAVLNENLPSGVETHAGSKAPLARPIGYEISWWKRVLEGYTGTVYCNPAYITWIPNTVTHLPRFDSTTLDSQYWAKDTEGVTPGTFSFQQTAEPVSLWTQVQRQGPFTAASDGDYVDFKTTERRFWQANVDANNNLSTLFEFTGRHLNQKGDDLLPLGGAYVKYVSEMWDGQGASTASEITGTDENNNGLADWWEKYAAELVDGRPRYLPEDDPMTWGTFVTYSNGRRMTAGEAYLLDLAKGLYADENGNIVTDPAKTRQYRDTVDEDGDGLPDNWEKRYGIHTGDRVPADSAGHAKEDPDHDGLPNAVEYLLSEVFDFQGLVFDPTKACSVDEHTLDYFFRVGELYVGEIFTDHDLVDDSWENLYEKDYASILNWDALRDFDGDGWSNRSENRYSNLVMPIVADKISHYTAADGLVADYPIPTLKLTLRYNGNRQDTVSAAPVVVQVTQDAGYTKDPDATFSIGAAEAKADTGKDSKSNDSTATASAETAKTRTIGKWSNRHAIGTLTPGNIKQNSLALEFCYDPSSVVYSWDVQLVHIGGSVEVQPKRGTRAEYDADKRRYGEANVKLISADTSYAQLKDLEIRANAQSSEATWIHTKSGETLGTVNLVTGEFDLNLGVFEGQYVENGTNGTDIVSLEDQTFRITYTANASVGLPRELYLGAADKGRIKEGRNTVVAWADLDGDGAWTVGEPYGIRRDVDVSWKGTSAEIELTDIGPATRVDLVAKDGYPALTFEERKQQIFSDRQWDPQILWVSNNVIESAEVEASSFREKRIRVVRWLVNDVPVYIAGCDARVVLDKKLETDIRTCLTEADFLSGTNSVFDLDWANLRTEVADNFGVRAALAGEEVTRMTYLIVVGDGAVEWESSQDTTVVRALDQVIERRFGAARVTPRPLAPGAVTEEIVTAANPTFTWTADVPEEERYTAFSVKVTDASKAVVYSSGIRDLPPRTDGSYSWKAPLFVGDKTTSGKVFANKARYFWTVSMYNAKYSAAGGESASGQFYLNVQTNGTEYGTANVAVRYFGPTDSWAKKNPVVRVRAYTSPDFTGTPVAAGYVADPANAENGLVVTGREVTANCRVIGIPAGTYYLQAFIDSNGNGTCDPWESSGYLCSRSLKTPTADYLDPLAMTFGTKQGTGDTAVIYLEDADTDNDGLPDAWEYALYGNLTTKGVESLTETKAGESLYSKDLAGKELSLQADPILSLGGLAGQVGSRFLSSAGMLALAMSAPIAGDEPFAAAISRVVEPELAEGGVKITALEISGGTVTIALDIETTAANTESSLAKYFDANGDLNVTCKVLWTPTLANEPTVVATKKVTVGKGAVTLEITDEDVLSSPSGFFSVSVEKE